jgi:hypothetical protein
MASVGIFFPYIEYYYVFFNIGEIDLLFYLCYEILVNIAYAVKVK